MRLVSVPVGSRFRAGEVVEIRSREEILASLDASGCVDGLPFMPEMLRFCGQRVQVDKVAHKTCDTIHYAGNRRMPRAVHLEGLRCDGSAHGGCGARCLFFWKDVWLRRPGEPAQAAKPTLTEADLEARTRRAGDGPDDMRYVCQVTQIPTATHPLRWWNVWQYVRDVLSGNFSVGHVLSVIALAVLRRTIPVVKGYRVQVGLYNWLAARTGRPDYTSVVNFRGEIPLGGPTPAGGDTFNEGDWVRVRSVPEIARTLNVCGQNRGMYFDVEMVPYCGSRRRVERVIHRLIDESSGRMIELKNPCVALEGVFCRSEYSTKRLMCPRSILAYWRPNWLEKVPPPDAESTPPAEVEAKEAVAGQ